MNLTSLYNLKRDSVLKRINEVCPWGGPLQAVFRCVLMRKGGGTWGMFMGRIEVSDCQEDYGKDEVYKYPEYIFIKKRIKNIDVSSIFFGIDVDGALPIDASIQFDTNEGGFNWSERLVASHMSGWEFPIRRYAADVSRDMHFQEMKLVAHGLPFYSSARQFVKDFLLLETFHGSMDARGGELLVDVVDRRAALRFFDGKVGFSQCMEKNLSLVGEVDGNKVILNNERGALAYEQGEVANVELWLVDSDNQVMDYFSSSEGEGRQGKNNAKYPKELVDFICCGESDICEFKKYIDVSIRSHQKVFDIEKTVCALSNHKGGKLFIGVNDEASIVGIGDECSKGYRCSAKQAVERYRKDVSKILSESLSNNQCFEVRVTELQGLYVLLIGVDKVGGLNYIVGRSDVYVRRGASSVRMSPPEIMSFREDRVFSHSQLI